MKITFSIDWLAFTLPLTLLPSPALYAPIRTKGIVEWTAVNAHNGYSQAWRNGQGVLVQWNDERPEMRVLVQYSGQTLARYAESGIEPNHIIQTMSLFDDYRLTRIDLAFDCRDSGMNIQKLYRQFSKGNIKSSTTKCNLIVGTDGGQTLYVGSRQSDKFVRVYDKAAEQQEPGDWIRTELEIKGDTARELGKRLPLLVGTQLSGMAKSMLWNMVQFQDDTWATMCNQSIPVDWTISHKKADNIKNWLASQVAPALASYLLQGGDNDIIDQLVILVKSEIRRKSRL